MNRISCLQTRRNTWRDVVVFNSDAEARAAGYSELYYDDLCNGMIYGKHKDDSIYHWFAAVVFSKR